MRLLVDGAVAGTTGTGVSGPFDTSQSCAAGCSLRAIGSISVWMLTFADCVASAHEHVGNV